MRPPPVRLLPLAVALLLAACDRDPAPANPAPAAPPSEPRAPAAPPPAPPKDTRTMLEVGDPAPAFRVLDHTGRERTLAEFQGRRVILWFFPKALTGG